MVGVAYIRELLSHRYMAKDFVTDKSGVKTVEIINANFVANEPFIFGSVNEDYVQRELAWYRSTSLNVNDIPGSVPQIWKQVADKDGFINSNYGWCIFSEQNNYQYYHVLTELEERPDSRRATMIYTRPTMWGDHNKNGRSDFMCTNAVQYLIRNGKVHAVVQMRSNDAIFGYKNDWFWQKWVLEKLVEDLNIRKPLGYTAGDIHWNVGSLHTYERHFPIIENYIKTGKTSLT